MYNISSNNKNILYVFLFNVLLCFISNSFSMDAIEAVTQEMANAKISPNKIFIKRHNRNALYVSKSTKLTFSSAIINDIIKIDDNIKDEDNPYNHLKNMNDFLVKEVEADKEHGWSSNHLAADLFVTVYDTRESKIKCISGSLLAEKNEVNKNIFFDFSISPNNRNIVGKTFADFVASSVPFSVLQCIEKRQYIPITQGDLRPIVDQNNHGDRLAVDTILTNIDLFFSLIRKSSHRSDLKILSMGVNYYSSYDACNDCFEKLYDLRKNIGWKLAHYAATNEYNYEADFPFHTIFHSSRPYKETSYALVPKGTNDIYPVTNVKNIYNPYRLDFNPKISFSLKVSQTPQESKFRDSWSFDLYEGQQFDLAQSLHSRLKTPIFSVSDFESEEERKVQLDLS